jgi:hypothetical protein
MFLVVPTGIEDRVRTYDSGILAYRNECIEMQYDKL